MSKLRCRPGDLARVVYSKTPSMVGRTILVDDYRHEHGRWRTTLLGVPSVGQSINTGMPMVSNTVYFRDSSLVPLRGEEPVMTDNTREIEHA